MKIIHTGDWHIGKLVHGIHMTQDQSYMLDRFVNFVEEEKPDIIIIAGDIYDRSVPPIEAVELLNKVLTKLVLDMKIKVFIIAGNHDSPDRVGFAGKILEDQGLYISGNISGTIKPIQLEDSYGKVNIYLVPFVEPAIARHLYQDETLKSHDDVAKKIIGDISGSMNKEERNICVAHNYLTGTHGEEISESVRPLSIGGSEFVSYEYYEDFDYVALGHLHRPQKVIKDYIRYSGSLLKYSFSEAKQKKGFTVVDLKEKGNVTWEIKQVKAIRDLRVITGELNTLISEEFYKDSDTEDYIMALLTDTGELVEPMNKLRSVYPNILRLEKEITNNLSDSSKTAASEDFRQKPVDELFEDFYTNICDDDFSDEEKSVLQQVLEGMETIRRRS